MLTMPSLMAAMEELFQWLAGRELEFQAVSGMDNPSTK